MCTTTRQIDPAKVLARIAAITARERVGPKTLVRVRALAAMPAAVALADPSELCEPGDACPECSECRFDELLWVGDDGEKVRCHTCGHLYECGAYEI